MSRFVRPDITTLHISDGDTLTVKKRLNHGEKTACFDRMYRAGVDGALRVNPLQTGMAIVTAYLVDWSLRNDAGELVVIREQPLDVLQSALDALDPDSFTEIKEAIEAHDAAMTAERDAAKKKPAGTPTSAPTSPSPSAVGGDLSGSENLTTTSAPS